MISKITDQELDERLKALLEKAGNIDVTLAEFFEQILQEFSQLIRITDNSRKNSDPLGAYPDGITIMRINIEKMGFPKDFGVVITHKSGSYGFQFFSNNSARVDAHPVLHMRSWMPEISKWTEWDIPETAAGAQDKVNTHQNRKDNPHSVTKSQVGLGNVDNVKQATKQEFDAHLNDKTNPHGVTKSQVGLGNVDNIKQATKQEFDTHLNDKNNPHGVTKSQVGLGNVDNIKQASKTEFDNHVNDDTHVTKSEKNTWNGKVSKSGDTMTGPLTLSGNPTQPKHASTKEYVDSVRSSIDNDNKSQKERLDQFEIDRPKIPFGLEGQVPFINKNNSNNMEVDFIVSEITAVDNDLDLESAKAVFTSNIEIFDKWGRFSHNTGSTQPANMGDLNSWRYDSQEDLVVCTINSTTYIGFYSDKKYDTYVHQVTLASTDNDDDDIGVLIAFAIDANGREHTLSAIRCTNLNQTHTTVQGENYNWAIIYNHKQSNAKMIANGTDLLTTKVNTSVWRNFPNGTTVRIHRKGDIIEAVTSEMNSTTLNENTKLTIDLTSDPVLAVFRGPQSYGYTSHSQNSSTYKNIYFSDAANVIYDIRNGNVWVADSKGNYKIDNTKKLADLGKGRIISNESTGRLFFVRNSGEVVSIGPSSRRFNQSIAAGRSYAIDTHALFGPNVNARNLLVQVTVKDTDSSSPTRGMFINSEAVATLGKDDRYITIVNEYTSTLEFDILIVR